MKRKRTLSFLMALALLTSLLSHAAAVSVSDFNDVSRDSWYYEYVDYVVDRGYFAGTSATTFSPDVTMTRAMFVTVLARLDEADVDNSVSSFVDVPTDTWYTGSVTWASENGIVSGVGNNHFNPEQAITRQEMCVIMDRFIDYYGEKTSQVHETEGSTVLFPDNSQISSWAAAAVGACREYGLINGYDDGYFHPLDNSTRAQVAAVISRLDWLVKPEETPDSTGGSGGGGGGGGGGDTPEPPTEETTSAYRVNAVFSVPDKLSAVALDLQTPSYTVTVSSSGTVTGDKTFREIAVDLVSGENETAIRNAINEVLDKAKTGEPRTLTVNEQRAQVTISNTGVISVAVSMNITDLTDESLARVAVTQDELISLINKLQAGGSIEFTDRDVAALDTLLKRVEQLDEMTDEEIQDKMDQYAAGNSALEQAMEGMTVENVRAAAGSYKEELTEIQQIVESAPAGEPIVIEREPVEMMIAMDLGAYYDQIANRFESSRDSAIDRLEEELKITFADDQRTKAEAVYDLNDPANYIIDNGDGTLTLRSANDYVGLVQENVAAVVDFYDSLDGDEDFYQGLLDRLESKNLGDYDVNYEFATDFAGMLADKSGILAGRSDTQILQGSVSADEDTYGKWLDLLSGRLDSIGSILPGEMPNALADFLGDYTLTLTIDKI